MLTRRADCLSSSRSSRSPAWICGATARSRSRGFSFTEILFSVIVLGIGFIMIAAIFPVAIQQGKLTSEEGAATGVAREALSYLGQVGANSDAISNAQGGPLFPATGSTIGAAPYLGNVYSFRDIQPTGQLLNTNQAPSSDTLISVAGRTPDELWNRLNLSLIVPSDQRYAFVGLYRRNGNPTDRRTWSPFVQAWFIPVTTRSRSIYNTAVDPYAQGTGPTQTNPNLQARLVQVQITDPTGAFTDSATGGAGYVLYNYTGATGNYTPSALNENCYIIVANDYSNTTTIDSKPNPDIGRMNGHVFHVGLRRPDLDTSAYQAYDLAPNGGFAPDPGADGFFGNQSAAALTANPNLTMNDDILAVGNTAAAGLSQIKASQPADAYIVGNDLSPGADPGTSQDISAFTTFIKVN
jgi:type II secretory pathway pseudopilin PulG